MLAALLISIVIQLSHYMSKYLNFTKLTVCFRILEKQMRSVLFPAYFSLSIIYRHMLCIPMEMNAVNQINEYGREKQTTNAVLNSL